MLRIFSLPENKLTSHIQKHMVLELLHVVFLNWYDQSVLMFNIIRPLGVS